jgi:1,2-diacylglycerol-3-alpha-glucose alpha-1,2-galactosyltransferase
MRVVQISESEFSVKGHGVHTAYIETYNILKKTANIEVSKNSFRKSDVRHIHTIGPYSLLHLIFGSGKKVVSAHVVPESFIGSLLWAKYWQGIAKAYLKWFYNRADVVIAVSGDTEKSLLSLGVKSKIITVSNMIDVSFYRDYHPDKQALKIQLNIPPDKKVVVANGQIQPRKRVDMFIEMAKNLPEIEFIWVGGIPFGKIADDFESMNALLENAPSNMKFTGVVERGQVRDYFAVSDIFVMPSDQETFGLAIIEAAACGLPVLIRDIRDYDHTFRDDAVICSDTQQFVDEITKILSDQKYFRDVSSRSHAIADKYDSAIVVEDLLSAYRS